MVCEEGSSALGAVVVIDGVVVAMIVDTCVEGAGVAGGGVVFRESTC